SPPSAWRRSPPPPPPPPEKSIAPATRPSQRSRSRAVPSLSPRASNCAQSRAAIAVCRLLSVAGHGGPMMTRTRNWLLFGLALWAGCSDSGQIAAMDMPPVNPDLATTDGPPAVTVAPGPSRGSAIALSSDDAIAVVVNRDVGTATVLALAYPQNASPTSMKLGEVALGAEPWQAVIAPDGNRAFVILRKDQKLVAIDNLKTAPTKGASVSVGSEPTGVALTPTGAHVWVSNWVDGTLMEIDPATMAVTRTVDLNAALVASGILGAGLTARPSMSHPRSLAITNNGDQNDNDESIYVTEYYGQRLAAEMADGSNADVSKQGVVYRVKLADLSVLPITLSPLA